MNTAFGCRSAPLGPALGRRAATRSAGGGEAGSLHRPRRSDRTLHRRGGSPDCSEARDGERFGADRRLSPGVCALLCRLGRDRASVERWPSDLAEAFPTRQLRRHPYGHGQSMEGASWGRFGFGADSPPPRRRAVSSPSMRRPRWGVRGEAATIEWAPRRADGQAPAHAAAHPPGQATCKISPLGWRPFAERWCGLTREGIPHRGC
jgi:hypothetical protein